MNWFQKKMAGHSSSALLSFILGWLTGTVAFLLFYMEGMPGVGVASAFMVSGVTIICLFIYHLKCQGMHERIYGGLPEDRYMG